MFCYHHDWALKRQCFHVGDGDGDGDGDGYGVVVMMVVGVWEEAFGHFLQLSECGSLSQQPTEENCYKLASNQHKFVSHSK